MRITIIAKTKSHNPNEEELDKSVDELIRIADRIKGYEWKDCECSKETDN